MMEWRPMDTFDAKTWYGLCLVKIPMVNWKRLLVDTLKFCEQAYGTVFLVDNEYAQKDGNQHTLVKS